FSSFKVKMEFIAGCWGIGHLNFWHKYQTDSTHAGGFIDISYDTSEVFHNIIFDTIEPLAGGNSVQNFYTENDTITGNIPAFTGNSNGWQYSSVFWVWQLGVDNRGFLHDSLTIRFNFKSDGTAIPMEGWMVDDIYLQLDYCSGGIEEMNKPMVSIYPNPVNTEASIALVNFTPGKYQFKLLNELGKVVMPSQTVTPPMYHFKNPGILNGIYFYRISDAHGQAVTGKMVIVK
ncbi:MAG: T9SS type A sorting domain-containing protein, partial [Bacteroidota bacterium]